MDLYKINIIETASTAIKFTINYTAKTLDIDNIKLSYNNTILQGSLNSSFSSTPTFTLKKIDDYYLITLINVKLSCNDITTLLVKIDNRTTNTLIIATCESLVDYSTSFPLLLNYMPNGVYKINAKSINNTPVTDLSSDSFVLCSDINLKESSISLSTTNSNLIVHFYLNALDNQPVPSGKYRIKIKYKKT